MPGDGGAGGADAHGQDRRVGEPVGQGQADHGHPARRGKPERTQPLRPGPDDLAGFGAGPAQHPGSLLEGPCGWPLERAAQPRPPRSRSRHHESGYGEHAAGNGDRRDQDVPGRQRAADHDQGRRSRGDHPAGQQRPAGQRGVRALPGEAAERERGGQGGSGQRNRDRHRVGRVGGGQHRPDTHAGAACREQPAQHDREGGHGRRLEQHGGRNPPPVQMTKQRERRGQRGPPGDRGNPGGRQRRNRDDGGRDAGHLLTPRPLRGSGVRAGRGTREAPRRRPEPGPARAR